MSDNYDGNPDLHFVPTRRNADSPIYFSKTESLPRWLILANLRG